MQFTVEDVSSVKKVLHIDIPEADVTAEVEEAYNQLKKTSKIKGYRPGKAPRNILEKMFSKDVNADVSGRLIQNTVFKAITDAKLRIVSQPIVEPVEFSGKGNFKYSAKVEIRPEIAPIDISQIKIKKTNYAYSEGEVDAQIEMLRKSLAKKTPAPEGTVIAEGSYALISYEGFKDGVPFEKTPKVENQLYRTGSAMMSKMFDDELAGLKKGDEKTFTVSYPSEYVNKQFAGNDIEFRLIVNDVMQEELPELDDDFAKNFGKFETVEEIRNEIRSNLKQGYDKRIEQEMNEQVFSYLLERSDFEVPESMLEMEIEAMIDEGERACAANGITLDQIGQSREALKDEFRETAEKQVRRHLALTSIIEHEKMTLSDEDLEEGYESLSKEFNRPVEMIREFYKNNPDKTEYLKITLLEKKAVKVLIEKSEIKQDYYK
jgi:trigger factor